MNATPGTTLGDIVSGDYRAAAVFQKHGIDFCCGGTRTIEEACRAKQIEAAEVLVEIERECAVADDAAPQYATWEPSALVAYIISKHHAYVTKALPAITAYTHKLAAVHGANHPELLQVDRLFAGVAAEMTSHMMKEERILFPFIVELEDAAAARRTGARAGVRHRRQSHPDDGVQNTSRPAPPWPTSVS